MARRNLPALAHAAIEVAPSEQTKLARKILRAWEGESHTGSENTATAKRSDLEAFGRFLELGPAKSWSEAIAERVRVAATQRLLFGGFTSAHELVRAWMAHMAERIKHDDGRTRARLAPSTRARRLAHLRGLVRVAAEYGLPWSLQIRGPRIRPYRDASGPEAWKIYSAIAELARASLRASTAPRRARAARDCAILQLLFCMGLRRQSVADLQLADLEGDSVWLRVKGEEEPRRRTVPPPTVRAIAEWLGHRGREPGALFVGSRGAGKSRGITAKQIYRIAKREAGNPHGLRHAGATKLAREGRSVFDLQAHLGHRNAMSAQHYVDAHEDAPGQFAAYLAEQLADVYDRADDDPSRFDVQDGA